MKKAAFFVEGQTELIFLRKLLTEIAGVNKIAFHEQRYHGKSYITLASDPVAVQSYFVLIVDCCADNAVASAVNDRHSSLAAAGYDLVIGLRDLHPLTHADLAQLKAGLAQVTPNGPPATSFVVAVAEVEAWFMQENLHFPKIDPACTRPAICTATGYDIETDLAETLPNPAVTLDLAYKVGGKRYKKSKNHVNRTVGALDYQHLYLDRRAMIVSFDELVTHIEAFLT